MEVFEGEAVSRVGQNVRSMEVSCCCAHVKEKWVLPEVFRSRVIATRMHLQSDEFPNLMTKPVIMPDPSRIEVYCANFN